MLGLREDVKKMEIKTIIITAVVIVVILSALFLLFLRSDFCKRHDSTHQYLRDRNIEPQEGHYDESKVNDNLFIIDMTGTNLKTLETEYFTFKIDKKGKILLVKEV